MKLKLPYILLKDRFYPIIPVGLITEKETVRTEALVDSGANISIFHSEFCKELGLKLESGEKKIFQGIGGKITGFIHNVKLNVNEHVFLCKIAFSNEMITGLNIIGRENFFEKFIVTFDDVKKEIELKTRI
jgi:hypothetical protein